MFTENCHFFDDDRTTNQDKSFRSNRLSLNLVSCCNYFDFNDQEWKEPHNKITEDLAESPGETLENGGN